MNLEEYKRKIYETVGRLSQRYPTDQKILELEQTIEIIDTTNITEYEAKKCLKAFQKINDHLFQAHGVSDEIIDFQLLINKLRNKLDITDENETINDEGFVQ